MLAGCALDARDFATERRAVIGGSETPEGLFPAVGALLIGVGSAEPEVVCSGTLIAPDAVLTAAHCLDPLLIEEEMPGFTLALDANTAGPSEIVRGAELHQHAEFDPDIDPIVGLGQWFDIGVLILAEEIDTVDFAYLPSAKEGAELEQGQEVDIVGYGVTTPLLVDFGVKHHASAHIAGVGEFEILISTRGEPQNCFGDSGGPALADFGGGPRIVGIVSRSPDPYASALCEDGGVDTRVDWYLEWIHSLVDVPCGGSDECGGGCSCRASERQPPWSLALLALLALAWRRR
jgi:MYXO-CTERM domain-containing protein